MNAELKDKSFMLIGILAGVCAIASFALGMVYQLTKPRIEAEVEKARTEALLVVHPNASPDGFELVTAEHEVRGKSFEYFRVYDKPLDDDAKKLLGYACEGQAQGYSSTVVVTVGLDANAEHITGIKVTAQQETPGLGTRCDEVSSDRYIWDVFSSGNESVAALPWFQEQFFGKPVGFLEKPIVGTVPQGGENEYVHGISGATITTKAVVRATAAATEDFRQGTGSSPDGAGEGEQ